MNINEAEKVMQARITAASSGEFEGALGRGMDEEITRSVMSDLDLDYEELISEAQARATMAMMAIVLQEQSMEAILAGLFFQGFILATLIAKNKN